MLAPYARRYRGRILQALAALTAASAATLVVPLAVRRMIDHGFTGADAGLIDRYFLMLLVVAGALAAASSARYYLVTWRFVRVVADLRGRHHEGDRRTAFRRLHRAGRIQYDRRRRLDRRRNIERGEGLEHG